MYTSSLLIALAGLTASAQGGESPNWLTDYVEARKAAAEQSKPLAVVFGVGKDGWQKVARGGALGTENQQLLATQYVCVYVDNASDEGKRIAKALEVNSESGLVISDRLGRVMAFHHQGNLSVPDLAWYLKRYAAPGRTTAATETEQTFTTRSFYPPTNGGWGSTQPVNAGYQPAMGNFSTGRSC